VKNLLAIDPGIKCLGWAFFEGAELKRCGVSRTEHEVNLAVYVHLENLQKVLNGVEVSVVVERPEVYLQRYWKGDPRDLISVAVVAGAAMTVGTSARTPQPKEWKGSVPKEISHRRILSKLSSLEKEIAAQPVALGKPATMPPSLAHNMWDAIGLGIWALGR